jgi:serine/threonine-protein kinase
VILLCLAKKPEERYRDVKTLCQALAACTSADDWHAEEADRWWADHVPTAPVDAPPQPVASG